MRKAKIVCTIGPASDSEGRIAALIRAGMDAARLNFSHGDHSAHLRALDRIRRQASKLGRPVAVIQDLQGPKIRVGRLKGGALRLRRGQEVVMFYGASPGEEDRIPLRPGVHLGRHDPIAGA